MIRTRANAYEIPSVEIALALWRRKHKPVVAGGRAACTSLPSQAEIHGPRRDEPSDYCGRCGRRLGMGGLCPWCDY